MKSTLSVSPVFVDNLVSVKGTHLAGLREQGKNCTFGVYFGLSFPSASAAAAAALTLCGVDEDQVSAEKFAELTDLAFNGMCENDAGYFLYARLYLSKLLKAAQALA